MTLKAYLRKLRILLASRKLFRNWLSAGIKYYLVKSGFLRAGDIEVVCGDGSKGLIPVRAYGVLVDDYYDGYVMNYDCREGIATYVNKVRVPIGELEKSGNGDIGLAVENGWVYDMVNMFWLKDGMKFRHMYWPILEVFDFGNYEGVDVDGKVVIDVGAFVGDTAMYFILKGARRVIAIEPLPANYEELLDNIHLNGIEGRIIPINAMVSSRRMIVEIPTNAPIDIRGGSIGEFRKHGAGSYVNIESITINDIINRFGINPSDAMLKMDCEGCEFDVILNDYEHVRLFRELIFEYHPRFVNKSLDDLLHVLGRDYECNVRGNKDLGIMHCVRK